MNEVYYKKLREGMVSNQIAKRGIVDKKILTAFSNIPRHLFVPLDKRNLSYEDSPLPIGENQTISQPYMTALMTKELSIKGGERVLEIGTGSGYQAAILSHLGAEVYTIERIVSLAERAGEILSSLGYGVKIKVADGTLGWQEYAPYGRIIVTAASPYASPPWLKQLEIGGRIVLPLGDRLHQELTVIKKVSADEVISRAICGCIFVPLVGKYGYKG